MHFLKMPSFDPADAFFRSGRRVRRAVPRARRSGCPGLPKRRPAALLLLAAAYPVHAAFEKHPARALKYGLFLGLVFTFFLGVGSELMFYDQLLPGMGSLIRPLHRSLHGNSARRRAVFHLFALPRRAPGASRRQLPYLFYFLVFALSYGATLLCLLPRHHQL